MRRHLLSCGLGMTLVVAMVFGVRAAGPPDFVPDATFTGSSLSGWRPVGAADWSAENGEIVGRPRPGSAGAWLVMDKSFEDVQWFANIRCTGACKAGVLLRATPTAEGGMKGIFVSFADGDFASYRVTLDAEGRETSRVRLGAPPAANAAPGPTLKAGEWNPLSIAITAELVRPSVGPLGPLTDPTTPEYGRIALHVGGTGELRYKDVSWRDINGVTRPKEQLSSRFTLHRVSEQYDGWSAAVADFNRDGIMDIASGPFTYLGPTFEARKQYRVISTFNAGTDYGGDMMDFAYDFTGDGWPDILTSDWDRKLGTRPMFLYVNPRGESRRWNQTMVLPTITTETVLMHDLDGDKQPEMLFGTAKSYAFAKINKADPTATWPVHDISGPGVPVNATHGFGGVGDVNGDGRLDVVVTGGWFEQPAGGIMTSPWTFHPQVFGTATTEMGVFDVNGDGLTDVISSVAVHGWGLAWFEQKRAADGARTWVRHDIAGDYSTKNTGNVVFSEAHAAKYVDMSGDGIKDFVIGKRSWPRRTYQTPDPFGPAVIYIYRTVRNPKAPGGAEFVPELVHNRSGAGSTLELVDMNNDGKLDIVTATVTGTFAFVSK
jgi:hypothetical protein